MVVASIGQATYALADEVKIVKIGMAGPLTGFSASYGKDEENAAKLAFEEANKEGLIIGGQRIQFEVDGQDDASDPRTAVLIAQRFVDEGVSGVIGHHDSGCSIAASAIYNHAGIPEISPASSSPAYTGRGFDTVFRTITNDDQMAFVAAKYSVKTLGAKRIAVIDDSSAYGTNLVTAYVKAIQNEGASLASRQSTTTRSIDFRAILTAIKAQTPDLIFFVGQDIQAAGVVKQFHQLGIRSKFVGESGLTNENFLRLTGKSSDGMYTWEYGLPLNRLPRGEELDQKMKARFGVGIVQYAPLAYDAAWAMINAMKAADSTNPKRYLQSLRNLHFDGVTGPIAFTVNGDLKAASATLYQQQGGKWVVLGVEQTTSK